jgi:hypothetical protein
MSALPSAVELLQDNPELVVLLAATLRLARAYQTELSWSEYRMLHRLKRGVFPLLDRTRLGNVVLLVSDKGGRDDGEYVATVQGGVRETAQSLRDAGGSLHLLNSLKRRPGDRGDPLTDAHVLWTMDDGHQVECYLFDNDDGTVDVYCHTEASVSDPLAHLTARQEDGDGYGVLPPVVADGGNA